MTREDVKAIFPNATDEEITKILNAHHSSMPKPAVKDDELAALREKAKKFDDYQAEKLSIEEKAKKALAEAEELKSQNQRALNRTKGISELVKGGFTADEAERFIDSIVTDSEENTLANARSIAEVYKAKSEALVKAAKEELMKDTPKPDDKNEGQEGDADKAKPPAPPKII